MCELCNLAIVMVPTVAAIVTTTIIKRRNNGKEDVEDASREEDRERVAR